MARKAKFTDFIPMQVELREAKARIAALEAKLAERVKVKPLLIDFEDFINEPTQYEELRTVRDYRHELYRRWEPLCRAILSALEATPPAPCDHPIWGQDIDGTRTCAKCGLTTPPTHPEPDFSKSIADIIKEESANGAAVGWRSCTGCHETNEGYETGHFPYSKMFGCYVGSGCSECGGIGVTWEYWSEDVLKTMAEDDTPPAPKVTEAMVEAALKSLHENPISWESRSAIRAALTAAMDPGQ